MSIFELEHSIDNAPDESDQGPRAAQALKSLSNTAHHDLTQWYVKRTLADYQRIFALSDEAGGLDNLSRRFAWVKRVLQAFKIENDRKGIFLSFLFIFT